LTPERAYRRPRSGGLLRVCAWTTLLATLLISPMARGAAAAEGWFEWPVRGPVIRAFEGPSSPYGPGHRGIDIATPFGTPVLAPAEGEVTFAGWVAGARFVTIDHGDAIRSTSSWLSDVAVRRGDLVARGQVVGRSGHGHAEVATPHLHFGVRIDGEYVDPMLLLGPLSVVGLIHLAPLGGSEGR
jgi:murein DD-endopeptidase MepM/ murein hydrolase activator NlpD